VPGSGNGQLPAGFLPITDGGVTKKLYVSAQQVAAAVAAQKPAPTPPPSNPPPTGPQNPGGPPGTVPGAPGGDVPSAPTDSGPSAPPSQSAPPPTTAEAAGPMPPTQAVSSRVSKGLIPALVLVGLLGLLASTGVRFFVRPPRGTR
jgi:hypothetical protein